MYKYFLLCLIITASFSELSAQCLYDEETGKYVDSQGNECGNAVVSALPFLRITPDARSGGMGDAGLTLSPDPNAMHHNASRLAFAEKDFAVALNYSPWLRNIASDLKLMYLSTYYKFDDLQSLGFALRYFSLGEIEYTDPNGSPTGTGNPNEFEIAVAYSRKLSENFSAAVTGKFIYSNLAAGQFVDGIEISPATSVAADLGLLYNTEVSDKERLKFGLALTNLGAKVSYIESDLKDFIPTNLGFGAGYELNIDEFNKLNFLAEVNKLLVPTPLHPDDPEFDANANGIPDFKEQGVIEAMFNSFSDAPNGFNEELRELMYSFGVEYWYNNTVAFRTGYFSEHVDKGNRKYLTFGAGLKYSLFGLDVSYLVNASGVNSPLENTLRFSLYLDLESFTTTE